MKFIQILISIYFRAFRLRRRDKSLTQLCHVDTLTPCPRTLRVTYGRRKYMGHRNTLAHNHLHYITDIIWRTIYYGTN